MSVTIQIRRDTAANWTSENPGEGHSEQNPNPPLAIGEMGLETDTKKFKVGDGSTVWNSLGYWLGGGGSSVISGLTLSNNTGDSDHDIDIAVGEVDGMELSSILTKQIDAAWAAGDDAGGLFSGTVAADTWYSLFLIKKDSDGSIDAGFDTSVSAENIPTGYTAYRYIGSVLTDSSSNILPFTQYGDWFFWVTPILDINNATISTTSALYVLSAPPGRETVTFFHVGSWNVTTAYELNIYSPDVSDQTPSYTTTGAVIKTHHNNTTFVNSWQFAKTNTAAQVRARADANSTKLYLVTAGFIDTRGN